MNSRSYPPKGPHSSPPLLNSLFLSLSLDLKQKGDFLPRFSHAEMKSPCAERRNERELTGGAGRGLKKEDPGAGRTELDAEGREGPNSLAFSPSGSSHSRQKKRN